MPPLPALPANAHEPVRLQRTLAIVLSIYLAMAWFGGGPTVDVTALDEWLMSLALVPLVLAAVVLSAPVPTAPIVRLALFAALLLPLIPLLQLVPLPEAVGRWSSMRAGIASDLQAAGVMSTPRAWSLWPEATARSMFAVLPALACFLAALTLSATQRRRLATLVFGLVLANLVFGFFQVGLPPESSLRLYTNNGSGLGGVLVNGNHQGTALIVGMLLALGLWSRERRHQREQGNPQGLKAGAYATAAFVCLATVPLTGSSGAMVIAILAFGFGLFATGLLSLRRIRHSRAGMAAGLGGLAVLAIGLLSAQRFLDFKSADAMRYDLAREVTFLGVRHAPFGSGAGTFVDSFAQSASPLFQRGEYINHAHNEFVQWWFEAGWPALALLFFALTLLGLAGVRLWRTRQRDSVALASWTAVVAVLAHSWVDFPLRTLSLMSVTALLAGLAIAAASRTARELPAARERDVAPQRA